jgi:hypothetical protein
MKAVKEVSRIDPLLARNGVDPVLRNGKKEKAEKKEEPVRLFEIDEREMVVEIVGSTDLIVNRYGHIAKDQIQAGREKRKGKSAPRKEITPEAYWMASLYPMPGFVPTMKTYKKGKYGVPASGLKKAIVSACAYTQGEIAKTFARGGFHVDEDAGGLVEVKYKDMALRTDDVRIGQNRTPDVRYRASFQKWSMQVKLRYNAASGVGPEVIVNLLNLAGFHIGLCEWRAEKGSMAYGSFRVTKVLR